MSPCHKSAAQIAALVLAAGASRRMGGEHKALRPWLGRPLVVHQADMLLANPAIGSVVVVVGAQRVHVERALWQRFSGQAVLPERLRVVYNAQYDEGRSTSVKVGMQHLGGGHAAYLVVSVDQPLVRAVLDPLVTAALSTLGARGDTESAPPLIVAPEYEGRRGHPTVFHGSLWPRLCAVDEASAGLRSLVQHYAHQTRLVAVAHPAARWNLNTPAEFDAAEKWLTCVCPPLPNGNCTDGTICQTAGDLAPEVE